jgi:hypothetical protein
MVPAKGQGTLDFLKPTLQESHTLLSEKVTITLTLHFFGMGRVKQNIQWAGCRRRIELGITGQLQAFGIPVIGISSLLKLRQTISKER